MTVFLDDELLVRAIGWTLLHTLWQGVLFAALLALLLRMMRAAPSNARYAVACGAMTLLVTSALLTFALLAQRPQIPRAATPVAANFGKTPDITTLPTAFASVAPANGTPAQRVEPLRLIVTLWLAGTVAMAIWHVGGWLLVVRLRRGRAVTAMQP